MNNRENESALGAILIVVVAMAIVAIGLGIGGIFFVRSSTIQSQVLAEEARMAQTIAGIERHALQAEVEEARRKQAEMEQSRESSPAITRAEYEALETRLRAENEKVVAELEQAMRELQFLGQENRKLRLQLEKLSGQAGNDQ